MPFSRLVRDEQDLLLALPDQIGEHRHESHSFTG